jgi:hypothetical protein
VLLFDGIARCELPPAGDPGSEQGLFLCLPPEHFDADQFAGSGPAADMAPGPMLATIMDLAVGEDRAGLSGLAYDQLIGVVAAARRMQSRFAWGEMAAMREFAARAAGQGPRGEFAADELAGELNLTWQSAAGRWDTPAMSRSGCRGRSRLWERDGCTPSRSGSSRRRPVSCRPRMRLRPTPSWPRLRGR